MKTPFRRLLSLDTTRGVQRQVDDELRFHIESRAEELVRQGMSSDAALWRARSEFGDVEAARKQLAAIDQARTDRRSRAEWWEGLAQDATLAFRAYQRRPLLAVVILLTLGLGVGANSAIFSVAQAVLLRSLPYRDADRLVRLWETRRNDPNDLSQASYPGFLDWRAAREVFAGVEGFNGTNVTVSNGASAERVRGVRVTAGFFDLLGTRAMRGRTFAPDDDPPGGSPVVVITYEYWQRRFGAGDRAVGASVQIDGSPHTVIGVLPASFRFVDGDDAELYFPLGGSVDARRDRSNHWVLAIARLRDGVTLDVARERATSLMRVLATTNPETNDGRGVRVLPLHEAIVGPVQGTLHILLGAVAIVLLVACANVASLMLARAMERSGELALRTALGASRARLVRLLLTESLLLAIAGGVLGAWIASVAVPALVSVAPPAVLDQVPRLRDARVDGNVLLFTMSIAIVVGVAFGLAPALSVTRVASGEVLRTGARGGAARSTQRLRDALVAGQIACVVVLLSASGLLARSLGALLDVDPGFDARDAVAARIALAGPKYRSDVAQQRFFEELLSRVRSLPGVVSSGAVSNLPLQGGGASTFRVEGEAEPPESRRPEATMRGVAQNYFRAMGIRLIAGRELDARDDSAGPPAIVISETLARQLFGDRSALDGRLRFYAFPSRVWTVVGVVGDVKTSSLDAPSSPIVYFSHLQRAENRMTLAIRTRQAGATIGSLNRIVADMDRDVAVYGSETLESRIEHSAAVYARRYPLTLIGSFAGATLALAVVGLYGLIAYSVAQRTRELAIRLAIGATNRSVLGLVLSRGLRLAVFGIVVGVPIAFVLERSLASLLYGVNRADPWTYVGVTILLVLVGIGASYLPARRATRVDVVTALRAE